LSDISGWFVAEWGPLQAEGDGQDNPNGDGVVANLADAPLGHLADDAHRLAVQAIVARATNDADVAHPAVGAHDEAAQHTSLDAVLISLVGILAGLVDEVDEASLATGELGLNVYIFKLIDFHVRLLSRGVDRSDMAHLRYHGQCCGQRQCHQQC